MVRHIEGIQHFGHYGYGFLELADYNDLPVITVQQVGECRDLGGIETADAVIYFEESGNQLIGLLGKDTRSRDRQSVLGGTALFEVVVCSGGCKRAGYVLVYLIGHIETFG